MKRVFRHYTEWEDAREGMWRSVPGCERERYRRLAASILREPETFHRAARAVVREWPASTEVNLSTRAVNRQAWLGAAACCIAARSPEDCTREAWRTLTPGEQETANAVADGVIRDWEVSHAKA